MRRAVIDLGSNSVRIVVYQLGPHGIQREIDNLKQTVRLADRLDADGRLKEDGVLRTIRVVRQFVQLARLHGVSREAIIGAATYVFRAAKNGAEALRRIEAETGVRFRLLSGEEEAYYGYLAVVHTLPVRSGATVDIGGGSTEMTLFEDGAFVAATSLPYGAVSVTRALKRDPPADKDVRRVREMLFAALAGVPWIRRARGALVGIGGTVRAIAKIHQAQSQYPLRLLHGYTIPTSDVGWMFERLRRLSPAERTNVEGLSRERADIIVGGALLLSAIVEAAECTALIVSDKGLRDGLLLADWAAEKRGDERMEGADPAGEDREAAREIEGGGKEGRSRKNLESERRETGRREAERRRSESRGSDSGDPLFASAENMIDQLGLNRRHAHHTRRLIEEMLFGLEALGLYREPPERRRLLRAAALLHDAGQVVNIYDASSHAFYVIAHGPLYGVTHRERLLIALVASYKSPKHMRALMQPYAALIDEDDEAWVRLGGALLRLARVLDRARAGEVEDVAVCASGPQSDAVKEVVFVVRTGRPPLFVVEEAEEWVKKIGKRLGVAARLAVEVARPSEDALSSVDGR
ncbi:MAG: Ppx/GppA family phosphatase [Hydrogenibacillus schlegelii]|nr:Ppx/GppA family phosphatase [Hydrogenibacillus schlegelii]